MANLQTQNISTLEDQGKALAEEWDTITKGDKKRFNKSPKLMDSTHGLES